MAQRIESLLDTWYQLIVDRKLWEPQWQEIADYITPRKARILRTMTPGTRVTNKLMDATAVHANKLLAASMQGNLTSASVKWFTLRIPGLELEEVPEATQWLDSCSEVLYDLINQSNAASEFNETYQDLGAFGTGCLFIDERAHLYTAGGFRGLRFTACAPGTYAIDEDDEGRVNLVYRSLAMSARAAYARWGERCSEKTKALVQKPAMAMTQVEIVHAVYPREDYDPLGKGRAASEMRYASCYVEPEGRALLEESGFPEFPYAVPRWEKTSGEVYGRGPGDTALPDVKTLNKDRELKMRALGKKVEPPLIVQNKGILGLVRLTPGGINYATDVNNAVRPLELAGRLDEVDMETADLRASIRRIFFSDQLQLQEGPQMTAYEVQVRYELMQRILGPTLGRLEVEFLDQIVNRTFNLARRAGRLPEMPEALAEYFQATKQPLRVKYEGPLARAQRLSESVAIQRFFQIALPIAQADQDVLDLIDMDVVVREHAMAVGVPPKILRAPRRVAEIREAKRQAREEMAQQQQMAQMAQGAGQAAPMLKALIESQKAGILPSGMVPGA